MRKLTEAQRQWSRINILESRVDGLVRREDNEREANKLRLKEEAEERALKSAWGRGVIAGTVAGIVATLVVQAVIHTYA